jgi:hypothetical protein
MMAFDIQCESTFIYIGILNAHYSHRLVDSDISISHGELKDTFLSHPIGIDRFYGPLIIEGLIGSRFF